MDHGPMGARAREIAKRGAEIREAPILTKMGSLAQFTDDLADFLVELADQVDANRPYLDEEGDADDA